MRYLVVANQTLNSPQMIGTITQRIAEGGTHFHIVVPATHPQDQASPVEGDAFQIAEERLQEALDRLGSIGAAEITGEVGADEPLQAIGDALAKDGYGTVIISTLPLGTSRWLRRDLPTRVRKQFPDVLVDHVVVDMADAS